MERKNRGIMNRLRKAAEKERKGLRIGKKKLIAAGAVSAGLSVLIGAAGFYNISTRTMVERTNDMVLGADYVEWMSAQIKDATYQSLEEYSEQKTEGGEATLRDYVNTNDIEGIASLVMSGIDERYESTGEAFSPGQRDQMVRIVESEINNSIEDALTDLTDQNVEAMTEKTYQYVAEYVSDHMRDAMTKASETAELSSRTEKKTEEIEGRLTGQEREIKSLSEQSGKEEKAIAAASEKAAANEKAVTAVNEKVTVNEKAVAAVSEKAAANEKAVTAVNEKVTVNEKAMAAMSEKAAANEKAVALANEKMAANERAIASANEKAAANERAVTAANEKVDANERAVTAANEKADANERAVTAVSELASANERAIASVNERLGALPDQSEIVRAQEERLSEINSKTGTNTEKLLMLQEQVDQDALHFSQYAADSDTRFEELSARLNALESRSNTLELDNIYPVGSIYISASPVSPAEQLGGEWQMVNAGKTLVGAGAGVDAAGQTMEFQGGATGGEYAHILSGEQLPRHSHSFQDGLVGKLDLIRVPNGQNSNSGGFYFLYDLIVDTKESVKTENITAEAGSSAAVSLMQPYVVVYMWQRTA